MSPAERDRVESLLRQSGLVDNAARPAARAMPDQRQYHLQVQREDGRTAEASFGESQLNAAGAELVQFLNARSAPMPRR